MSTILRPAALSVTRTLHAFLAPILVYAASTAGMTALTALVTASITGGGNTGALTVFLLTTTIGLFAIACSVIDVVRAGFDEDLATLAALGYTPTRIHIFTATQSLVAFLLGLPLACLAAVPTYWALLWLLRTGGFHGLPQDSAIWPISYLTGITLTALLAAFGGWRARPLRVEQSQRRGRNKAMFCLRITAGVAAVVGAVALLLTASTSGPGALFGGALVWVIAAVLLAPAIFTLLCCAPLLTRRWPAAWAAQIALSRDRIFRLSSSVTVSTFAVVLFAALVSMISTVELLQRAALAELFTPTAAVATASDGSLLPHHTAERICRSTSSCAGLIHIGPDASGYAGIAYADKNTREALFTWASSAPAVAPGETLWSSPHNGLTGSPWQKLRDGAPPEPTHTWRALPVFVNTGPLNDNDVRIVAARSWAQHGPSQAVIRGAGAADIGPMLAPLITLSLLFSVAAVYLLNASFHRTTAVTTALGASKAADVLNIVADAAARTATVYVLTLVTWWVMGHTAAYAAPNHNITPTSPPRLLHASFAIVFLATSIGGFLGTRAGRELS
ncbi:hypothetical protein [Dermatophilus congolensis]|uniref:hypothetical protein n=1 Tax=Dermatophilus congolensis TaxID=1863 RepID=UPI001AAE581D|nr:hypothetical protein [Dermatophilus congolensis]MBO3130075.1 hypothetical protein [Dermatophilus congolensis]MBO3131298.1 hypothetical protein [Dermatophilus congolensis]MBO3134546.1 hypothetical protein [Dermatophilus congolensis]MBO3136783.1 hypothetical protein [Dermatophilus congolensis]MBO3139027.1 hypothetical protein [Dermatophilus congolensis]